MRAIFFGLSAAVLACVVGVAEARWTPVRNFFSNRACVRQQCGRPVLMPRVAARCGRSSAFVAPGHAVELSAADGTAVAVEGPAVAGATTHLGGRFYACRNGVCVPVESEPEKVGAPRGRDYSLLVGRLSNHLTHGRTTAEERKAIDRVLRDRQLMDRLHDEIKARPEQFGGIDPDRIGAWLELFVKYAPQIIALILQIVAMV